MIIANFLSGIFILKTPQNLKNMARHQLLLPQHRTRLCYQQYLKYRGVPSTATVQLWQHYYTCTDSKKCHKTVYINALTSINYVE